MMHFKCNVMGAIFALNETVLFVDLLSGRNYCLKHLIFLVISFDNLAACIVKTAL